MNFHFIHIYKPDVSIQRYDLSIDVAKVGDYASVVNKVSKLNKSGNC